MRLIFLSATDLLILQTKKTGIYAIFGYFILFLTLPTTLPMSETDSDIVSNGNIVIVIGRQFGSGGRQIGRLLAAKLGIRYYDKELLSEAAVSLGYAPEIFAQADERRPSPLRSLLQGVYGIADNFHTTSMSRERLYHAQSLVIQKICSMGSCVIVGRTADHVMRHHPGLVSVFLHAPLEKRAEMIVRRNDARTAESAMEMARKFDHAREGYYNYFTGRNWGSASNYHLSLDTSAISGEDAIGVIIEYARARHPECDVWKATGQGQK